MKNKSILFLIFITLTICCKNEKTDKINEGWDGGFVMSITPLADGGAYVEGYNGIWYLKNNVAVKVLEKRYYIKNI